MRRYNKKMIQNEMIKESNHTDTRIKDKFTGSEDERWTTYVLQHCRTKCRIKKTNFVWSIADFWNICNFMDTLTSSDVNGESCKIDMCISRENNELYFWINSNVPNPREQINIHRYNVYIQSTEGAVLCTDWKRFHLNTSLYEVCLETLRLNEAKYLPNDTLSVHFTFESCENIVHVNMYENIIDAQQLPATANNFVPDESDTFVTFVVDEKRLCVNKSLLCANSSVFNKMLKKRNEDAEEEVEKEIKINDISFEIFQIIILYIKQGDFKLDFSDIGKQNYFVDLLVGAHRFDINGLKVICEKHLIQFITKQNAISYLDIAISTNALFLANYVKRFIKLHIDDFRCTTEFSKKIQINPQILYDVNEQKLFEENAAYNKYNDQLSGKESLYNQV